MITELKKRPRAVNSHWKKKLYEFGRTPMKGDQPVARPLSTYTQHNTKSE
jgi:hypothetical protein